MYIQFFLVSGILNVVVTSAASQVRIPLFITPLKALPQPLHKTLSFYSTGGRDQFFSRVTAWDVWKATNYSISKIQNSSVLDIISQANSLYQKSLQADQLKVHLCGSHCYVMNLSDIEAYTRYTKQDLSGQSNPPITLKHLHEAVVLTLEQHFCFTMSYIEEELGISSFNVTLPEWKQFIPKIASYAIQCRADILAVERSELAELVRTDEAALLNYSLAQLDSNLILPYLNIIDSRNMFENYEIGTYITDDSEGSGTLESYWSNNPLYTYIYLATSFTIRDLEILYESWNSTQLYALQFIPLESYNTCSGVVSLERTMHNISTSILEDFSCPVALVLSTSVGHVQMVNSEIENPLERSVLEIFTTVTGIDSWIEVADILQLNYTDGLLIDTPRLREIVRNNHGEITGSDILNLSVPQIMNYYISLDHLLYIFQDYAPMFNEMLSTYAFSRNELLEASGKFVHAGTTITKLHEWLLTTVRSRYDVHNIASLTGYAEYFPNDLDLVALPSSQWPQIINAVIHQSFKQVMHAFSYDLQANPYNVTLLSQPDKFQTVVIAKPSSFNDVYITRVSSCLFQKAIDSFESSTFKDYHRFYNNSIAKTMRKKIIFETETLESLLSKWDMELEELENVSLSHSIKMATGFHFVEIECLYGNSISSLVNSAISWNQIWDTKLCYSFTNLTLLEIVTAVKDAPTVNCEIDEVNCSSSPCHTNEDCVENGSGYECVCKLGFVGKAGVSCADINECAQQSTCHSHASCENTIGSYSCSCKSGFVGNGIICADLDECSNSSACHSDATCKNTIGSYACSCKTGFTGNGITECTDSSDPSSSSSSNIGVIVGVVVAAMVVIIAVIIVVACILYRRKPGREKGRDIRNIQNAAYEGDIPPNRQLPKVPYSDSGYEEPAEYAQLDRSRRVPVDANYQSLKHKNKQGGISNDFGDYAELERENENDQRYTSLGVNSKPDYDATGNYITIVDGPGNEVSKESVYEELP